jgi:hypothetical protein
MPDPISNPAGGCQSWDNLKMPMVVIFLFILNGSGMDDIIIIGIVQLGSNSYRIKPIIYYQDRKK